MTFVTVALKLLQAGLGSMLAGLLVWLVSQAAVRRWPALAGRRALWLGAQGVVASVCLAALLPQSAQWSVLPAMTVNANFLAPVAALAGTVETTVSAVGTASAVNAAPAQPGRQPAHTLQAESIPQAATVAKADSALRTDALSRADTGVEVDTAAPAPGRQATPDPASMLAGQSGVAARATRWPAIASLALLALLLLYPAGLAWSLARIVRERKLWRALGAAAQRLTRADLRAHPAFTAARIDELERHGFVVLETLAAVSPMLLGLHRPRLLLPRHLRSFDPEQQQLIIEHELTHWRRADPWLRAVATTLQTMLWFNPALRWLGLRLSWAQELACDRHVLRGRPQRERQSYAAALVRQLHLQGAQPMHGAAMPSGAAGLAFGGAGEVSMAARIKWMRQTGTPRLSVLSKVLLCGALGGIVAAGAMLQPAFAWTETAIARPAPPAPTQSARPASLTVSPTPAQPALSVQPALSAPPTLQPMPAQAAPPWVYPLDKVRVTSFYRVVSTLLPDGHHGIDLAATRGTPVHAVAAGRVLTVSRDDKRYGNFIVIEHAQGKRSLYAHLDSVAVRDGEPTVAGQIIGKVGATGMATGPHLHFEAYQGGQRIDPRQMLSGLDALATPRALRVRKAQFGS